MTTFDKLFHIIMGICLLLAGSALTLFFGVMAYSLITGAGLCQ